MLVSASYWEILVTFSEELSFDLVHCRDDLARAIKKLHVMGSGFQILPVGNKRLVQSVPGELSMDHAAALQLAQVWSFRLSEIATPSAHLLSMKISEKSQPMYCSFLYSGLSAAFTALIAQVDVI